MTIFSFLFCFTLSLPLAIAQTPEVTFDKPAAKVDVYDFAEVVIAVKGKLAANPFTDVTVTGEFRREGGEPVRVDGFCDSTDGSLFRVRFMPSKAGQYDYKIIFQQGGKETTGHGQFAAVPGQRKGIMRTDAQHPEHFVWEGSGEHYYWNGTTTYYLLGWDEATIRRSIDRLVGYKVNRLRVLLYGRNNPKPWGQPVVATDKFKLHLNPWESKRPDNIEKPEFDLTRFNVDHWQKYERLLRYAREKGVIVSVIFFIGGQVLPTPFEADSAEEDLYYRYGVARLAAFSNVTWDLGNEYNFHRPAPAWADRLGAKVKQWDPYDHLCSAHNITHRTKKSGWCDMQLIQRWDSNLNAYMLNQRALQKASGKVIPQINEEYGYEDLWEKQPGHRSAATRRRCAWEIAMAGCYQTTGESARTGTGVGPDTGGGWVNGRGDESMTMLGDNRHLVNFFTALDWWTLKSRNDLIEQRLPCLTVEGKRYVVYLPSGGSVTLKLSEGKYDARWFNPRSGQFSPAGVAVAPSWTSPDAVGQEDWVLLLERNDKAIDRTLPRLLGVNAIGSNRIQVKFSKSLDPVSAGEPSNYTLDHGARILSARRSEGTKRTVELTTSSLSDDVRYTLTVRRIRDLSKQPNVIGDGERMTFHRRNAQRPLVELSFAEGKGQTTTNTGDTSGAHPTATLTVTRPQWSTNSPTDDGASIDFGKEPGNYAVDVGDGVLESLQRLTSFTITGWLNCRSLEVGPGGNRIVHMAETLGSKSGFDLVVERNGSLMLGINAYPDGSPARSSKGAITTDPDAGKENWRFFAVTYDATLETDNVKFYLGDSQRIATLDHATTYRQGRLGPRTGPLTIGSFGPAMRDHYSNRMFRGLIDDVRVFGSLNEGAGALPLEQIRGLQQGGK